MKKLLFSIAVALVSLQTIAAETDSALITPFERSHGTASATYDEMWTFYKNLKDAYPELGFGEMGPADNGYPMRYIAFTNDGQIDPADIRKSGKVVILINNAIHAGEPDGVDACMMLLRDAATKTITIPDNVVLVVVPMYNIGGALNRGNYSRANQNGPVSYGFRGNARNLDLNRDFIKCDAAETLGLEDLFAKTAPDIFIDNHVSDGADYQHVMTLLETQHDKLGGQTGQYMHNTFTPAIYAAMKKKGHDLVPYVNDFHNTPEHGWNEFFDSPKFSSGYAALFQTIAYVPETHMLKPFDQRVHATYDLMTCIISLAGTEAATIKKVRNADKDAVQAQKIFPLDWRLDTTVCDTITFKGYASGYKKSEVSGLDRLYYDRKKPFTRRVPFYDHFVPSETVTAPKAYVIPKAWTPIIICLRENGVRMQRVSYDSLMDLTVYHIDSFETSARPYEKHYPHKHIKVTPTRTRIQVTKGDYIVWLIQPAKRYLIETLEPTAPDGFFAWNYFDAILQQKEYFSAYVFEDIAAELLKANPKLKEELERRRKSDPAFAKDGEAQLEFVYRHSPYMEPEYMRYPIYRLEE